MLTDFFLLALAVSGVAVLWRNHLEGVPQHRTWLKTYLHPLMFKALTCGSCFTYWLALLASIIWNPLHSWNKILISWMALSMLAVFIRFSYVLVQERVHDIVHARERHQGHTH